MSRSYKKSADDASGTPYSIISWSGGKDSTATIVLAHEHNIHIDEIIISLIWFDKQRRIYAEWPEVVDWIFNVAKPLFESWGYKVTVLESERDYMYYFYHIITDSEYPERNGKCAAFLMGGKCYMNREKVNPIRNHLKSIGREYIQYVGIAPDEEGRIERVFKKKDQRSLLLEFGICESDTFDILRPYNLISPTYKYENRGGCWFCPNQAIKSFARLKMQYPRLWGYLKEFSRCDNMVSQNFRYDASFAEVEAEVDAIIKKTKGV